MVEKVKKFVEHELWCVESLGYNAHEAVTRCYGAVMFILFSFSEEEREGLGDWWDDEMLPKFRELEMKG